MTESHENNQKAQHINIKMHVIKYCVSNYKLCLMHISSNKNFDKNINLYTNLMLLEFFHSNHILMMLL